MFVTCLFFVFLLTKVYGYGNIVNIAEDPPYEQYVDKEGLTTPKDYAEDNNHKNKNKINYDTWSLFDFIEIGLDL